VLAITGARFAYEVFVIARSTEWTTRQSIVYWDILSKVRYGYYVTVDRHGLPALAMTRVVRTRVEIAVCSPCLLFNLHPSLFHSLAIGGSPRQQGARDDKSG
jgi:hypothetical protein